MYLFDCQQPDYRNDSIDALQQDSIDRTLLLNVEYTIGSLPHVTLLDASTKEDVVKCLISDGLLMVENRREKRLQKLVSVHIFSCMRSTRIIIQA